MKHWEQIVNELQDFDPGPVPPEDITFVSHNVGEKNPFYGMKHTDEWKAQKSENMKGRIISQKHRDKISKTLTGVPFSEERKKAVSDGLYRQKHQKYAKFYRFEWRGEVIEEFNTIKQLSKKYDIPKTTLLRKLGRTK